MRRNLGRSARRKTKCEERAAFAPLVDRHTAAVRGGDLFDDRQPKSAAANAIGSAAAVERLEEMRQIARRDSGTAVFYGNRNATFFRGRTNGNPLSRRAVTDCVRDQVLHRACERRRVA